MALISSTTSAIGDAVRTKKQLKGLGIWDEGNDRAFPGQLSAIGAAERGETARYGAALASAKAAASAGRAGDYYRNKEIEQRDRATQQTQAGSAVSGFAEAGYKGYGIGKEQGWWGAKPPATTPAGNYPATEFGGLPAVNIPEVAPAASLAEALPPMGTAGVEAIGTGSTLATTGGAMVDAGTGLTTAIGVSAPEVLAAAYAPEVLAGVAEISATMGVEAATTAATAGVTDMMVAAGTAAMVPGVGWVVGAGIMAAAAVVMLVGGDGSVICTEMARQGKLDKYIWHYDSMYPKLISPDIYNGYLMLFSPIAQKMKTSKFLTNIVSFFGVPTATEMAHRVEPRIKGSMFGKIILSIGEPMCRCYYNSRRTLSWA